MARCWKSRCSAALSNPEAPERGGKMWPWQSMICIKASSSAAGIETVAQPIAEQVEAKDQQGDGNSRTQYEVRRALHVFAAGSQHGAPFGRGRLHAQSQETQGGGDQHGLPCRKARFDDDDGQRVWQDVTTHDAEVGRADRARRFD